MSPLDPPPPNEPPKAPQRLLVIRFSSFGDIVQASGVPAAFQERYPGSQVDWLVREDFKDLLTTHPFISNVLTFSRSEGVLGLIRRSWTLSGVKYTHIYDAHSNLRSRVVSLVFGVRSILNRVTGRPAPEFLRRPKGRLRRWLYFRWRAPVLPKPFRGADSFHRPLERWGLSSKVPAGPQFFADAEVPARVLDLLNSMTKPRVALAASAAWTMKRWPIDHWVHLIQRLPSMNFLLLGGPEDAFLERLVEAAPDRVVNLAGQLSLAQSSALLHHVELVIANDTGLLHVADQMERPTLALIGPTAFGYPSHPTSQTVEVSLSCKPCSKDGRGKCKNSVYQRCMVEITPERVADLALRITKDARP